MTPRYRYFIRPVWFATTIAGDETVLDSAPALYVQYFNGTGLYVNGDRGEAQTAQEIVANVRYREAYAAGEVR